MKVLDPSFTIDAVDLRSGVEKLKNVEAKGRVCYKSEGYTTDDSYLRFTKMLNTMKHESVMEHSTIGVVFVCNRGFSHELVRHRNCAFSQESTRYCNYAKDKFGNEITVIKPPKFDTWHFNDRAIWNRAMLSAEKHYFDMLEWRKPQDARGVLPIDVKTEIAITTNLREWKHILNVRTQNAAHPSMQQLMRPLLKEFQQIIPIIFDDITY